ncbi:MAG TPA: VacJ family lipoprotein [Stellaceae bacterium]|jgi:phospholipid-binding lipoprotein MlaA
MDLCPLCRLVSGLAVVLALATSGCATGTKPASPATSATAGEEDFNDPFEDTNRAIFDFNQKVDRNVLVPVAKAYRAALPEPVRDSLRDFLTNLRAPLIFANDTLQGEFGRAKDTVVRFVLNSTIGMAGFVDVAGRWGIPYHEEDFGVTLGVWGVPEGPYIVVPVLGPSNPRDIGGQAVESFGDPWNIEAANHSYLWVTFLRGGVSGIDQRSRYIDTLADIERTSLDYYATIRSLYRQRRAALIHHKNENLPPNPAFSENGHNDNPAFAAANPSGPRVVVSQVPNDTEVLQ